MKYLAFALCVAFATAAILTSDSCTGAAIAKKKSTPKGFPTNNLGHAHCSLEFESKSTLPCAAAFQEVYNNVEAWKPEPDAGGIYELKSCNDDAETTYIWAERLTGDKKYTDDVVLTFTDNGDHCHIEGFSRSQSMSYWDYYTNFCNIRNLLKTVPGDIDSRKTKSCSFAPTPGEQETEQCNLH